MPITPSLPPASAVIRYSPRPREAYRKLVRGNWTGAADSAMLDSPEIWNLAYLSHDFERQLFHPDPDFTVLVRRSTQARLDGTGPDLTLLEGPAIVASWLRFPAPRFVALIRCHQVLQDLPLFKRYGNTWLETIEERCRLCRSMDDDLDNDSTALPAFEQLAKEVLSRYQVPKR